MLKATAFDVTCSVEETEKKMKTVIFGPPGSGKGTYASRLQAKLGVDVIAMGDIFREIMKEDSPLEIGRAHV